MRAEIRMWGGFFVSRLVVAVLACLVAGSTVQAADEVLVADRLTSSILRYSPSGAVLGKVVTDTTNLGSVSGGMALSPDGTSLYVANRSPSRIVRYDYNGISATNPQVIVSNGSSTIGTPGSLAFSPDGSTLFVASGSGAGGVARLNPDGTSAGANLVGGTGTARTGLAFDADGDLFALTSSNGVVRLPFGGVAFANFVPSGQAGGGAVVAHAGNLYIAGAFSPTVSKFNSDTGALDTSFGTNGYISSLVFPASIEIAPDNNNSLLVGILGADNAGTGYVSRYSLNGVDQGHWADATLVSLPLDSNPGFREATGLLVVPEPATITLALAAVGAASLRRTRRAVN